MNRIAQRPLPTAVLDQLTADHRLLAGVLRQGLPPSFLTMFPVPTPGPGQTVQWQSPIAGQPKAFDELPEAQAQRVLQVVNQRRRAIDQAIGQQQAASQLTEVQARRLRAIISDIPRDALVAIGDEPMVLYWASAMPQKQGLALLPLAALGSAAVPAAAAVAVGAASKRPLARGWWWLLGLLVLLLLLVLWWLYSPLSPRQAPSLNDPQQAPLTTEELTITIPPPTPLDPAELWRAPPVPAAPAPTPPPEPEPEPVVEVTPVPAPKTTPKPTTTPVPKPAPKPAPKQVTISNAKEFCPGQRPAELAPEMVILFDASGSMRLNIGVTMDQEREYVSMLRQQLAMGFITGARNQLTSRLEREPTRITVARQSVTDVIRRLPSDVNVGLVTARDCPIANLHGFFKPSERSALISQVQRLQPDGGTPLADGIRRAASLLDGKGRESTILVVTDGQESCGSDPCAAARAIAVAQPHLKINVVDIGRGGGGNCMAQATGGQVYTATSVSEFKLSIERAMQDVQGPANCP